MKFKDIITVIVIALFLGWLVFAAFDMHIGNPELQQFLDKKLRDASLGDILWIGVIVALIARN